MPKVAPSPNLLCPIEHELFVDPVVTADGHTYERKAIERWFAANKNTSPNTGAVLPNRTLTPAHQIKSLAAEFRDSLIAETKFREAIATGDLKTLESCRFTQSHLSAEKIHLTALSLALENCKPMVVKWLLEVAGADVDGQNSDGSAPIHVVMRKCDSSAGLECLDILLENKVNVQPKDEDGFTALHLLPYEDATMANSIISKLLAGGAKIDAQNFAGYTPLMSAASLNAPIEVLNHFILNGAKMDIISEYGDTILHAACECEDYTSKFEVFRFLLNQVPNMQRENLIQKRDQMGRTILHVAGQYHQNLIIGQIIGEKLINVNVLDDNKGNAFHSVCNLAGKSNAECVIQCIQLLSKAGCPINDINLVGDTPLHLCLRNLEELFSMDEADGHTRWTLVRRTQAMIDAGARIDIKDFEGETCEELINNMPKLVIALRGNRDRQYRDATTKVESLEKSNRELQAKLDEININYPHSSRLAQCVNILTKSMAEVTSHLKVIENDSCPPIARKRARPVSNAADGANTRSIVQTPESARSTAEATQSVPETEHEPAQKKHKPSSAVPSVSSTH